MTTSQRTDESLRDKLLDQLAYLADEAEAIRSVIAHVPAEVLETHPLEGEPSVKELYALLLRTDEVVNRPFVTDLIEGRKPRSMRVSEGVILGDADWNDVEIDDLLVRLARARRDLVSICSRAPESVWRRTGSSVQGQTDLYASVYDIVQHDVDVLRRLGERLHDARLSTRTTSISQ